MRIRRITHVRTADAFADRVYNKMKLNDCKQGLKVVCRGKVGVIRTRGNRLVTVVLEDGSRGHYHPGNLILETDIALILNPKALK